MVDTNLPIKLLAESINTMVYIKNRSLTSAVYEVIMTSIQDFYRGNPPNVDHIRIFGSETYIFNESDSQPVLTSKAWKRYLVGYGARNQYRIFDLARNAVYVQRDVRFNEQVVSHPKSIITYDNSFQDKNTGDTVQKFPLLSGEKEQLIRFTLADENLTLHPVSSISSVNLTPIQKPSISLATLHLPAILHGTANAETPLSALTQGTPVPETPVPVPAPDRNQVPGTFEDSDNDLSDAPLSDRDDDREQSAPRRTGASQVDYRKCFQKGKAAKTKTNSSVPIGSPHSEASRILFDHALSQHAYLKYREVYWYGR